MSIYYTVSEIRNVFKSVQVRVYIYGNKRAPMYGRPSFQTDKAAFIQW
jgi:hypothetical protein